MIKSWWNSKTVWFNVFLFLSGASAVLAEYFSKGDFSISGLMLVAGSIISVVLRVFFTDTKIQ